MTTSPPTHAAVTVPTRRAVDRQPAVPALMREGSPRSDVFCRVEPRPGLARPQGAVVSLAG